MKKIILINATMMPNEGEYILRKISPKTAKRIVKGQKIESYIGYSNTAKFMSKILEIPIPVNRQKVQLKDGDITLVCKLKYRVKNPNDKGKFTPSDDDYEWYLETYKKIEHLPL